MSCWGNNDCSLITFQMSDCWALRRGKMHFVNLQSQVLKCQHFHFIKDTIYSFCMPMIAQGETIGLFYLFTTQPQALETIHQKLATTIAEQLSAVIANLMLREKLEHQSIHDPLTTLFNRRYLEEFMIKEIHRATRQKYPISVILLDVDYFKSFNDTLGHDAGDFVLKEIGELLKNVIRASDIACRYGGEEMMLILPEIPLDLAEKKAEEIREKIANLQLTYRGQTLRQVTASFGVSSFPEQGTTYQELITHADTALYQAKSLGRNQVVVYVDH